LHLLDFNCTIASFNIGFHSLCALVSTATFAETHPASIGGVAGMATPFGSTEGEYKSLEIMLF